MRSTHVALPNVAQKTNKIKGFSQHLQRVTALLGRYAPDTTPCDCGSKMALTRIYSHPSKTISKLYICGDCKVADRVAVRLAKRREHRNSRIATAVLIFSIAYLTARAFVPFAIHMITGGQADVDF